MPLFGIGFKPKTNGKSDKLGKKKKKIKREKIS
jgi:hypothetical protein